MIQREPTYARTVVVGAMLVVLIAFALHEVAAGESPLEISDSSLHARSGYLWPYETGPHYSADSSADNSARLPGGIVTQVGSFVLSSGELPFPSELKTTDRLAELPAQYFFVQSEASPEVQREIRTRIQDAGGSVVEGRPNGTIVARLNAAAMTAIQDARGLLHVEPYHPAFKLHPAIGRTPLRDPIRAASEIYRLDVMLWAGEDGNAVAASLSELGATVLHVWGDQLRVEAHRDLLTRIARLEPVRMIYETLPLRPMAEETTTTIQTGQYNAGAIPYHDAGIDGGGGGLATPQLLMVLDSGIQLDAAELSDTRFSAGTPGPAHRKVRAYQTTDPFGGQGDLLGCDSPGQGGVTHGHIVSSVALGRASDVGPGYGAGFLAYDPWGAPWKLDGVAPGAVLRAYDAQYTPPGASCDDPLQDTVAPGDLYNAGMPTASSLGDAYIAGARIVNFSWGSGANVYTANAHDIDTFMANNPDALVFVAAGDNGRDIDPEGGDGIPDELTLGSPATTKSGLAIGASLNTNTTDSQNSRLDISSVGPATGYTANRIAPQLMAPGSEPDGGGELGMRSEFVCRSSDNDQDDPVVCDVVQGLQGTSLSAPAAAGAALLVRDYFGQGFYPDRQQSVVDAVATISGALTKAILAASAEFMTGENLTRAQRWNNEQGYGRIQLDNVLPLENWPSSPTGMRVHDTLSGAINVSNLSLPATLSGGGNASATFEVCNDEEELRIVLAWTEPAAFNLRNNLNLEVTSPSGKVYRGNYFTDDNNRDGVIDVVFEDCAGIGDLAANGEIDEGAWSLPTCPSSRIPGQSQTLANFDDANPIEGVFLSPDPDDNGQIEDGLCVPGSSAPWGTDGLGSCGNYLDCATDVTNPLPGDRCDGGKQQTEIGTWSVQVSAGTPFVGPPQDYALVIAGGACLGSAVQWEQDVYNCARTARVVVTESDDITDSGCNVSSGCSSTTIENRTTFRVYDEIGVEIDCEGPGCAVPSAGYGFSQPNPAYLVFLSDEIPITDLTVPTRGNGALDVRDGLSIEVIYNDSSNLRRSSASMDCDLDIRSSSVQLRQFGQDSAVFVEGGCERAPLRHEYCVSGFCSETGGVCLRDADCPYLPTGLFEYGYPDRHMDAGENLRLHFAFASAELDAMPNVSASLRCVRIDADSPAGCLPGGAGCDPCECGDPCPGGNPIDPDICDPRRENNIPCWQMTILDSPQPIGMLPAGAATSVSFAVEMIEESFFAGTTPTVELLLGVSDLTAGMSSEGLSVSRHRLNVDETATYYNTDFPAGGLNVVVDWNNNEVEDNPINDPIGLNGLDLRFETRSYGDLTAGLDAGGAPVLRNQNLQSPWNFDANDGGFRSGLASVTNETVASADLIYNSGEDKNFNGIEDGSCLTDPTIACYTMPNDPRCPGGGSCISNENHANDGIFTALHHNQKGGCGWQTRPANVCTGDSQRGCFVNTDCEGTCRRINNQIVSTFESCTTSCPNVKECHQFTVNALAPCDVDADCGEAVPQAGDCQTVPQICVGHDGTCDTGTPAAEGGVLHTGPIGDTISPCDGNPVSQCEFFRVISGTDSSLLWWSLWLTPVIEKVDQSIGTDGLPRSRVEITQWAWNQSIDLPDENVAVSWEFDTDVDSIFPVDLVSDGEALGLLTGPFGPVTNAGAPRQVGEFDLFAPMGTCVGSGGTCQRDTDCPPGFCSLDGAIECHVDAECSQVGAGICVGPDSCSQSDFSVNGSDPQGNNRVGQNSCFFEGPGVIPAGARDELDFASPPDDDLDNDSDGLIDEFVTAAGPIRNMDVTAFGGPDMRLDNLEDLYGTTGNRFQGAIGLVNLEGSAMTPALRGYGLAVDDMFVEWREISLSTDETWCANGDGTCATLEVPASYLYEGTTNVAISLVDASPYNSACIGGPNAGLACYGPADCPAGICAAAENDCDLNGFFNDPGDDDDCDNNTVPDLVARASSATTGDTEVVILNRVQPGGTLYNGNVPTSLIADGDGVLYLQKIGALNPTITVTYLDLDDGSNRPCLNSPDPERRGRIQASATILLQSCDLTIVSTTLTDNGDADLFADTDETVILDFTVRNDCGIDLTGCTAQLSTNSEWIECIRKPQAVVGNLPAGSSEIPSPEGFEFKVDASADRIFQGLTALDEFEALFSVSFACAEFDTLRVPQEFVLPLDLNLSSPDTPFSWFEGFESATLSKFSADNLDMGLPGANDTEGLINGDGWRCQYDDPEWINSTSFGTDGASSCYPGVDLAHANAVFWQVDGLTIGSSPDGGRAMGGSHSMYYGVFLTATGEFTTPMGVVESVTSDEIYLGTQNPQLSFWHQASLVDYRLLDELSPLRSADRAVVQIQLLDDVGSPMTDWRNLVPAQNGYDEQAARITSMCSFDPVDDGNTEDDFFDPTDPDRDLGPSSSCFPALSFGHLGDTNEPFDTTNIGNATVAPTPADTPTLGIGTWVQSVFDLSRYRGHRAKIRFLVSAAKSTRETWDSQLQNNPDPRDDGWWIDDVMIDEVLTNPAQFVIDEYALGTCSGNGESCIGQCSIGLNSCHLDGECGVNEICVRPCPLGQTCGSTPESCGPNCSTIMANVFVEPDQVVNPGTIVAPVPGWSVSFNAETSTADACLSGTLQFRFCLSTDTDCDDGGDQILGGWSDNAYHAVAPLRSGDYVVEVRCSTAPECYASEQVSVEVGCFGGDNVLGLVEILAVDKTTLAWPGGPLDVDLWTSVALSSASELGGTELTAYPGTFSNFIGVTSISMSGQNPGPNQFHGYLAKRRMEFVSYEGAYYCNSKSWRSGGEAEIPEGTTSFGDDIESPIGRDRGLKNAIWGTLAPGKTTADDVQTNEKNERGRRELGRRGG